MLTPRGKRAFAVRRVDDEHASEALALGRNAEFMRYLDEIARRMRRRKAATLDEVCARFNLAPGPPRPRRTKSGNGDRHTRSAPG